MDDLLPTASETCAIVAREDVKRALLLFDRVNDHDQAVRQQFARVRSAFSNTMDYLYPTAVPEALRGQFVFSSKAGERKLNQLFSGLAPLSGETIDENEAFRQRHLLDGLRALAKFSSSSSPWEPEPSSWNPTLRATEIAYRDLHPVLAYPTAEAIHGELGITGVQARCVAVLENLDAVSNDELSWEQVVEFRKDKQSLEAYRHALQSWLTSTLACESINQARDVVARDLEAYTKAIRKFDLKTKKSNWGLVASAIGIETTAAAAVIVGLQGNQLMASLIGLVASVSVLGKEVGTHYYDHQLDLEERKAAPGNALALVFEARKFLSSSG